MSKVSQTKAELEEYLGEQASFIERSAHLYDQGHKDEAKRLAVSIRVLVHDTKQSKSLLSQLGLKGILFCDTSTGVDTTTRFTFDPHGLVRLGSVKGHNDGSFDGGEYIPLCKTAGLHETPKWVDFDQWWNSPIITVVVDEKIEWLTRKDVVLALANKLGGAHVDPKLEEVYAKMDKAAGLGFGFGNKKTHVEEFFKALDLASVRQIAHEVLSSLDNSCPEFC